MQGEWYWARNGEPHGPLGDAELATMIAGGEIQQDDHVWKEGLGSWLRVAEAAGVLPSPPPAAVAGRQEVVLDTVDIPEPELELTLETSAFTLAAEPIAATTTASPAASPAPSAHHSAPTTATREPGAPLPMAPLQKVGRASGGNYLVRHWRGELPLVRSYWVNGFLGNILAVGGAMGLAAVLSRLPSNYAVAAMWCAIWLLLTAIVVWQAVGVFRSANRHVEETGRSFWARAAQVVTILAVVRLIVSLAGEGVPAVRQGFEHAAWLAANGHWTIRALNDGTEAEIAGGIGHGLARDLEEFLDANPGVKLLHVNLAAGGLVNEARAAERLVRARGLSTYVSSSCQSACTLVFLGGHDRYMKESAQLGFHMPRLPGLGKAGSGGLRRQAVEDLTSAGVSSAFAERVARTPHSEMWFPTRAELLDAKVVTEVTRGDTFAISGAGEDLDRAGIARGFEQLRIYRVLKVKEPETYEKILSAAEAAFRDGKTMQELRAAAAPLLGPVCLKRLKTASDDAVLRFARLVVTQLDALQAAPGTVCYDYAMGRGSQSINAAARYFPSVLGKEELESMADLLEAQGPVTPAAQPKELELLTRRALIAARGEIGDDIAALADSQNGTKDPAKACRAFRAFYSALLRLPKRDAVAALRAMFGQA